MEVTKKTAPLFVCQLKMETHVEKNGRVRLV